MAAGLAGLLSVACGGAPHDDARRQAEPAAAPPGAGAPAGATDSPGAPLPPTGADTPAVAVTIDDLPWIGAVRPGETRADALRRLIAVLVDRDVPALAFANCDRTGSGAPLLRMWRDAGLALGNHTAAHLDLNDAPLERWLDGVRSCHETVHALTGERVWFRFPYLHQGPTAARQQAALSLLRELDSPVAHVTIDNSDWILAVAYGDAVRAGESARAAAIGEAFVEHILGATAHYQDIARDRAGRDVPHVLLLHANLLVADHVGTLLDSLQARGFSFVSVAEAQRDPVYQRPDGYTGDGGLSWLYRMAPASPEAVDWDDAEARRLRQRWR